MERRAVAAVAGEGAAWTEHSHDHSQPEHSIRAGSVVLMGASEKPSSIGLKVAHDLLGAEVIIA
ncbi:MAG: hypothetical protein H7X92_02765 [Chitinophagales bacterium]|nr:hypothetical protein [Hyphomicrobiales bacterium]